MNIAKLFKNTYFEEHLLKYASILYFTFTFLFTHRNFSVK